MAVRALIVAIEQYDKIDGFSKSLPGTHDSAMAFRQWLLDTKGVSSDNVLFCSEGNFSEKSHGATRRDVKQAILDASQWANSTEEFYMFLSGHGFMHSDPPAAADVFVCADFEKLNKSGDECLGIEELQRLLRFAMGHGKHYYFIDACRNPVPRDAIDVSSLGITLNQGNNGIPRVYTLFATRRGFTASALSGFAGHLVEGLEGKRHAKTWRADKMAVVYASLFKHLKECIDEQEVDGQRDAEEGLILVIDPPPKKCCTIEVKGSKPTEEYVLTVKNERGHSIGGPRAFKGATAVFDLEPDRYFLEVADSAGQPTRPLDTPPADLYEDCTARFERGDLGRAAGSGPPPAPGGPQETKGRLEIRGIGMNRIRVTDLSDGTTVHEGGDFYEELPPGDYSAVIADTNGFVLHQREVTLEAGKTIEIDLGMLRASPLHQSILNQLPTWAYGELGVEFSESIGTISEDDTSVWISLLGASRILGPQNFSKLSTLTMQTTFDHFEAGDAPAYVVAGFERPRKLEVADRGDQTLAQEVPGMHGVYEALLRPDAGPRLVTLFLEGRDPVTVATFGLPNRATLLAITLDDRDGLVINQFMLPMGHLLSFLDPFVQKRLHDRPLDAVRFITLAQRQFARFQPIAPEPDGRDQENWESLLYEKWLDPVMAIIASYELLRRGRGDGLEVVVANLRRYFKGLADTEAIAKLSGQQWEQPTCPPLLSEGVLAFEDRDFLPLRESRLDYGCTWTLWHSAQ